MGKDVRVKLKLTQLNKLMRSAPIQSKVNAESARIASRAGSKFRIAPSPHRYTARTFVEPRPGETTSDSDRLALLRAVGDSGS